MFLKQNPNVNIMKLSKQMKAVMTKIRDKDCSREDFVFFADRIVRFVVEEGLSFFNCKSF